MTDYVTGRKPQVTAEHHQPQITNMLGEISPSITVEVLYQFGNEQEALRALDRAVVDVAAQIRATAGTA